MNFDVYFHIHHVIITRLSVDFILSLQQVVKLHMHFHTSAFMIQVVGEHYSAFTSEDLSLSIGFESDKICLDVPEDGAQLKDNWKIYPRYDPTVS